MYRQQAGSPVRIARYYYKTDTSSAVIRTYRFVAPIDAHAQGLTTGAYPITIEVYRKPVGLPWGESSPDTVSARLIVVDRTNSHFGAGWWAAGVERLFPDSSGALLVAGDGSAVYFKKQGSAYVAPPGEHSALSTTTGGRFLRVLLGGRTRIAYSAAGTVDSIYDNNPEQNVAHYAWTGDRLDSITDPTGESITLSYSSTTVAVGVPSLNNTILTKDAATGDLLSIADPDGFLTHFTYEPGEHRMASNTERGSGTLSYRYFYDAVGRVDSVVPPGPVLETGQTVTRHYNSWQRTGAPGDSAAGDAAHPVSAEGQPKPAFSMSWKRITTIVFDGGLTERAYFELGRFGLPVYVETPGSSNATAITRDSVGQPTLIRTRVGARVEQKWNSDGNLTQSITRVPGGWQDRNGWHNVTTTYTFDPTWKTVTSIVPPDTLADVHITYDSYGRREHLIGPKDDTTTFVYTADGLLGEIHEPRANGLYGNQADTLATVYTYDPTTRNLTNIRKGGRGATYVYDANGSDIAQVLDEEGGSVSYDYDDIKRVIVQSRGGPGAQTSTVRYTFDDSARVRTMKDPNGKITTWRSDQAGRVVSECRPNDLCITYPYQDGMNMDGRVVEDPTFAPHRIVTNIAFDAAGHMTWKQNRADTVQFQYDNLTGGLTLVKNSKSRIARQYDFLGRLTCEQELIRTVHNETIFHGVIAWFDYDDMGRRSRMYVDDDVGGRDGCEGTYEEIPVEDLGQPPLDPEWGTPDSLPPGASDWVPDPLTNAIDYVYDHAGNLDSIVSHIWKPGPNQPGSATTWAYTYDEKNRLLSLDPPDSGKTVTRQYNADGDLAYYLVDGIWRTVISEYDDLGRIARDTVNGVVKEFGYDGLGRLDTTVVGGIVKPFNYDVMGNRIQDDGNEYIYGGDNSSVYFNVDFGRLRKRRALNGGVDIFYEYDWRGNQIRSGTENFVQGGTMLAVGDQLFEYDDNDHMLRQTDLVGSTEVCSGGIHFEERDFWYDGLGRRIFMRSSGPCSMDWGSYRYYWIDNQVIAKVQANSATPGDSAVEDGTWPDLVQYGQWFFYGPGTDNVLASKTGTVGGVGPWGLPVSTRMHFIQDERGSVVRTRCVGFGSCSPSFSSISPFGSGGTAGQPGFNGAESTGSGLVYMRNRWYDPNTGRFTQEDPVGYAGGVNLYAYAGGDPVQYSDPWGLCEQDTQDPDSTKVEVCQEKADLPGNIFNIQHRWMRIGGVERGLGLAGGKRPAEGEYSYKDNIPFFTKAEIVDETGRGSKPSASCTVVQNVNPSCVMNQLQLGGSQGRFQPIPGGHNCQTVVRAVLMQCTAPPPILPDNTRVTPRRDQ